MFGSDDLIMVWLVNRLRWKQAQADVSTALQRRSDLIGNLVESVKGQMNHETEIFAITDRLKIGVAL